MEETIHYSNDGYPVTVGAKFWNNDLKVCEITRVAVDSNDYPGGYVQTWHQTNRSRFDTVKPHHPNLGRLSRFCGNKDAERYAVGTNYSEVK